MVGRGGGGGGGRLYDKPVFFSECVRVVRVQVVAVLVGLEGRVSKGDGAIWGRVRHHHPGFWLPLLLLSILVDTQQLSPRHPCFLSPSVSLRLLLSFLIFGPSPALGLCPPCSPPSFSSSLLPRSAAPSSCCGRLRSPPLFPSPSVHQVYVDTVLTLSSDQPCLTPSLVVALTADSGPVKALTHQWSGSIAPCPLLRELQLSGAAYHACRLRRKRVTEGGHQGGYGAQQPIQAGAEVQQGGLEGGAEGRAGQLPDSSQQDGVGLLVLGEPSLVLQTVPQLQAGGGAGQGQSCAVGSRRGEVFLVEWRAEVGQLEEKKG